VVIAALLAGCASEEPPKSAVTLPPVAPWDSTLVDIDFQRGTGSFLLAEAADLTCSPSVRADGPRIWWTFSFGPGLPALSISCIQEGVSKGIQLEVTSDGEIDCPTGIVQRVEAVGRVTCEFEGAGVLEVVQLDVHESE